LIYAFDFCVCIVSYSHSILHFQSHDLMRRCQPDIPNEHQAKHHETQNLLNKPPSMFPVRDAKIPNSTEHHIRSLDGHSPPQPPHPPQSPHHPRPKQRQSHHKRNNDPSAQLERLHNLEPHHLSLLRVPIPALLRLLSSRTNTAIRRADVFIRLGPIARAVEEGFDPPVQAGWRGAGAAVDVVALGAVVGVD